MKRSLAFLAAILLIAPPIFADPLPIPSGALVNSLESRINALIKDYPEPTDGDLSEAPLDSMPSLVGSTLLWPSNAQILMQIATKRTHLKQKQTTLVKLETQITAKEILRDTHVAERDALVSLKAEAVAAGMAALAQRAQNQITKLEALIAAEELKITPLTNKRTEVKAAIATLEAEIAQLEAGLH